MKRSFLTILLITFFMGCASIKDIGAYTEGTQITEAKMMEIKEGVSKKSDVEKLIGYPPSKQEMKNGEIWRYPYTKIRHIGSNISETTVFEFNEKGVVVKKYKTQGAASSNPLLNAR